MTDLHPALIALDRADRTTCAAALLDLYHLPDVMPRHEWFTNLGQLWSYCQLDKHYVQYVRIINDASRSELDAMMTSEALAALNAMPPLLRVFRGCCQLSKRGLSWTTNPAVAAAFASKITPFISHGFTPLVLCGYVRKERAVYKQNGLDEIIATDVKIVAENIYEGPPFGANIFRRLAEMEGRG